MHYDSEREAWYEEIKTGKKAKAIKPTSFKAIPFNQEAYERRLELSRQGVPFNQIILEVPDVPEGVDSSVEEEPVYYKQCGKCQEPGCKTCWR